MADHYRRTDVPARALRGVSNETQNHPGQRESKNLDQHSRRMRRLFFLSCGLFFEIATRSFQAVACGDLDRSGRRIENDADSRKVYARGSMTWRNHAIRKKDKRHHGCGSMTVSDHYGRTDGCRKYLPRVEFQTKLN